MSLSSPIGLVGIWFASLVTVVGYQQTGTSATTQNALQAVVRAAEAGNRDAQFALAMRFTNGDGVFQDDVQAATWFRASAELTFRPTAGVMDAGGAVQLMRNAAAQGYASAQFALGRMLTAGSVNVLADPDKGPSRDDVEAYLWFDLCARHVETREERDISTWVHLGVTPGAADCAEARNELRNRMTAEQIGEGETRVLEWMTLADSSKR